MRFLRCLFFTSLMAVALPFLYLPFTKSFAREAPIPDFSDPILTCGGRRISASKVQLFKEKSRCEWPFEADEVILQCERKFSIVAKIGGKEYGVNGVAMHNYTPIQEKWKENTYIGDIIALGMCLCVGDGNDFEFMKTDCENLRAKIKKASSK